MAAYEDALAHVAAGRWRQAADCFEAAAAVASPNDAARLEALAWRWRDQAASRARAVLNAHRLAWIRHWRQAGYRPGEPIAADDLLAGLAPKGRGVALKALLGWGLLRRDEQGYAATEAAFSLLEDYEQLCEGER